MTSILEEMFGSVTLWARAVRTFIATFFGTLVAAPLTDMLSAGASFDSFLDVLLLAAVTGFIAFGTTVAIGLKQLNPVAPPPTADKAVHSDV